MASLTQRTVEKAWLKNPTASLDEIVRQTGASRASVQKYKLKLVRQGLLDEARTNRHRQSNNSLNENTPSPPISEPQTFTPEELNAIAMSAMFDDSEIEDDDETRKKLLKQVQRLALDPSVHPDTRLSATQVWVKLKDIARAKDLGPGPPRSREEILDRLARIMQAVGIAVVMDTLKIAFKKGNTDEEAPSLEIPLTSGASETPSEAGHTNSQEETSP